MPKLEATTHWLRAGTKGAPTGVDRTNKIILGYVVAQEGPFLEPAPRGEFDEKSLRQIVTLMKQRHKGMKSRFGHPNLSDDGLSKFMGRGRTPRMSTVLAEVNGKEVELLAVRADMHLAESAFEGNPNGNLGDYVLKRAEEDADSFATSLVLEVEEEWRLDSHKQRRKYDGGPNDGKEMPPLWRPRAIHASDFVDSGAAASSFLSADILAGLPDTIVRQGCELLDAQFMGQERKVVEARLNAFRDRYLSLRFGDVEEQITAAIHGPLSVAFAKDRQRAIESGELLTGNGVEHPPVGKLASGDKPAEPPEPKAEEPDDGMAVELYLLAEAE